MATTRWRIVVPDDVMLRIRYEEWFHELILLARVSNALRSFARQPSRSASASSATAREVTASFLYVFALLKEAIALLPRLAKHFRGARAYAEHFRPLSESPEVKDLLKRYLTPLRNQAVFHFDREAAATGLYGMIRSEYVFTEADGDDIQDIHHELADLVAVRFALANAPADADPRQELRLLVERSAVLRANFITASDRLIAEVLENAGCLFQRPEA